MRQHISIAIVAALLVLLAGTAQASIVSYSGTLDFDWGTNGTLNIQQFDAGTYGPLQAVTFYIAHSGGATFSLDNDSGYAITAYADMERAWTINDFGLNASATHSTVTPNEVLSADNGDGTATVDYTGPDGFVWTSVAFSDPSDVYNIAPSFFSNYTGTGTTPFNVNVTTFSNTIGYVNEPPNQQTNTFANLSPAGLRLNVRVDYQYDAVPEPGTMALLGLGLFGIGAWRKRRQAAA